MLIRNPGLHHINIPTGQFLGSLQWTWTLNLKDDPVPDLDFDIDLDLKLFCFYFISNRSRCVGEVKYTSRAVWSVYTLLHSKERSGNKEKEKSAFKFGNVLPLQALVDSSALLKNLLGVSPVAKGRCLEAQGAVPRTPGPSTSFSRDLDGPKFRAGPLDSTGPMAVGEDNPRSMFRHRESVGAFSRSLGKGEIWNQCFGSARFFT